MRKTYNNRLNHGKRLWVVYIALLGIAIFGVMSFPGDVLVDRGNAQSMGSSIDLDDYPGYPKRMDGMGAIDRFGDGEIVIDDESHSISPSVTSHMPNRKFVPRSWLRVGDYVGFKKNRDGVIISIYLLRREK